MDTLTQSVEALIFVAEQPISKDLIRSCLIESFGLEVSQESLDKSIQSLIDKYKDPSFSFEIAEIAEGYQFLTKQAHFRSISAYIKHHNRKKLSGAALETLAIITYKQPISKSEIENIRGVNSDYSIQKLIEKELIAPAGRGDGPGRPLLYATSPKFMQYFGIRSIEELPKPKDFKNVDSEVGESDHDEQVINLGSSEIPV